MRNRRPPKIRGFLRQLLPQECTPTCRIAHSLLCSDRQAGHHDEDDPPGHAHLILRLSHLHLINPRPVVLRDLPWQPRSFLTYSAHLVSEVAAYRRI
ncbi:hypothetical protein ASPCADRAFT_208787 [Aspergillus carbonarius ITEM 5010]|uniref:Uncharacterized protein n=1 Tax=Aspergillus carbonarius (strain ITEM 5010) TaxID=602072 RepID=A0A1R3RIH0_ASPC5|nr:hypothetical protein ASPCADRAFT_208787 [Aspergillus carbonarius ITEM 5010]